MFKERIKFKRIRIIKRNKKMYLIKLKKKKLLKYNTNMYFFIILIFQSKEKKYKLL